MSKPLKEFEKDPDATLDYVIDWGLSGDSWLASGDELSTSTWLLETGISTTADSNTTSKATVWINGGEHGKSYCATNTITTANGRGTDRSIVILVRAQ